MITCMVMHWLKMYMISLARTSCFAAESFFVCRLDNPIAYFSSRKEVSIADRVEGIAAINEDRKMRNIALALNNEEIMNKILENGYPDS